MSCCLLGGPLKAAQTQTLRVHNFARDFTPGVKPHVFLDYKNLSFQNLPPWHADSDSFKRYGGGKRGP